MKRSRSRTSTASDTARSTTLSVIAASSRVSSARYDRQRDASGSCPGRLPAKVIVAPNSPSARAQASAAPAQRLGPISGSVTCANVTAGWRPA